MLHTLERAATGRAKCRACGEQIAAGQWRLGERLPNPFDEKGGEMTHWFHLPCGAYRRPEPFLEALAALPTTTEPIDDRAELERQAALGVAHHRLSRVGAAERASSGRAACRACRTPIEKDAWRIALVFYEDGRFAPSGFIHVACAPAYLESIDMMARLRHFSPSLSEADFAELQAALDAAPPPSPPTAPSADA
jgi:ribosomal protein L37AE/L43A